MATNPVKAIREKCLDCCCGSRQEIEKCTITRCALYAFGFGKNPYGQPRVLTDEQRAAMAARLSKIRAMAQGEKSETRKG